MPCQMCLFRFAFIDFLAILAFDVPNLCYITILIFGGGGFLSS